MSSMPNRIGSNKRAAIAALALMLWLIGLAVHGQTQQPNDVRELPPSQTREREMTGAETHRYKFDLKANQFFQVLVEQKGVDVMLKLLDMDGKVLATMDSPNGKEGNETLSFVTERAGNFILEVSGFDTKAEKGIYTINRALPREATANDNRRVAVEKLFVEGIAARDAGDQKQIAIKKLEGAMVGWNELHDDYMKEMTGQTIENINQDPNQRDAPKQESEQGQEIKWKEARKVATELLPAKSYEKEIGLKESQYYKLEINAGHFLWVQADQLSGTNVYLTLVSPGNKEIVRINNRYRGKESLYWVAEETGEYLLEIGSAFESEQTGKYQVRLMTLEAATAIDRKRVEAQTDFQMNVKFSSPSSKVLTNYEKAMLLWKEIGDEEQLRLTLDVLALYYSTFDDVQKALIYFKEALALHQASKDNASEAWTQNEICSVYNKLSKSKLALASCTESMRLIQLQTKPEPQLKADILRNIAEAYRNLGDYKSALKSFREALELYISVADGLGVFGMLAEFEITYRSLGHQMVLDDFSWVRKQGQKFTKPNLDDEIALRKIGNLNKAFNIFFNQSFLSQLFKFTGNDKDVNKLIDSLNLSESQEKELLASSIIAQTLGASGAASRIIYFFGLIKDYKGEKQKALEFYHRALNTSKKANIPVYEALLHVSIATTHESLGDKQKALEYYLKALNLYRNAEDLEGIGSASAGLMRLFATLNNPSLAILFGKQAINSYQQIRGNITSLEKELQKSFLTSKESNYRFLADLLIELGSFAQAEKILAMLKQEEYINFVRRDAGELEKLAERVPLNENEKALIERYSLLADKITEIGQEFIKLDDRKRLLSRNDLTLSPEEQKRYLELEEQLKTANAAFQLFLDKALAAEIKEKTSQIEIDRNLQAKLRTWGEGTVALYTVAGADRYRVILTTPKVQVAGKTEIKIADLNKKVFAFRSALQDPTVDPRRLGKELYDVLIKPIEKELKAANAKTLIWSLDGTLRYIPLAALSPDGNRYLVEEVQNVILTPETRDDVSDSSSDWQALGLGVSEAQTVVNPDDNSKKIPFGGLPGTERELLAIVRDEKSKDETGVLPGRRFINKDFTTTAFKDALAKETADGKRKYNVVHIASHFRLGNKWSNSFILLGDGQILTLEEIRYSATIDFGNVELITLSACNTGFADDNDGEEIDSLARVIQIKSGKAVLATLWAVADDSTHLLMSEFYRLRKEKPNLTKSEAMQLAQQAMIAGKLQPPPSKGEGLDTGEVDQSQPNYRHPYYWSPFVLIGNWR